MAEVVIGIGTSHSPQLSIRASDWDHLLKKDQTDPRLDYTSLLKRAKPGLEAELTPEKFRQRDEACLTAVEDLGGALKNSRADVVVVFVSIPVCALAMFASPKPTATNIKILFIL